MSGPRGAPCPGGGAPALGAADGRCVATLARADIASLADPDREGV